MTGSEKKQIAKRSLIRRAAARLKPTRHRYAPVEDALPGRLLVLLSQLHRRDDTSSTSGK